MVSYFLETSTLLCLSRDNHAVWWPRFSPDGSKLVWFEMPAGGPHGQCFAMLAQDWPPNQFKSEVIVPLIATVKDRSDFPGMHSQSIILLHSTLLAFYLR